MIKTVFSYFRGHRFDPQSGNQDLTCQKRKKKENFTLKRAIKNLASAPHVLLPFAFFSSQKNFDVALALGPPYLLWNPKVKFCPEHRLKEMGIKTVWAMKTSR